MQVGAPNLGGSKKMRLIVNSWLFLKRRVKICFINLFKVKFTKIASFEKKKNEPAEQVAQVCARQ